MRSSLLSAVIPAVLLSTLVQAAVNLKTVGPLTSLASKATVCNVLNYGGKADGKTDIGPAILAAFTGCASKGKATLYIPPGSYSMATGVILNKGVGWALQLDGLITLTSAGSFGGNAIVIKNAQDVEVFSSNGLGAINGQGYIARRDTTGQNARLFRFISSTNVAIHDIILVDSPTFHLVFNDVTNLEAYQITIRGPNVGGTDGVDLVCTSNCYLHHIEVTNRDECISVKSPSKDVLIEEVYCNQSGGMSIGSLTADGVTAAAPAAAVSNITMRNIYVYQCTQMLMIKTFPGGSGAVGYVKDSVFENFWAYDTTYGLDIDQYWYNHLTPNTGAVALSTLSFNNWTGTVNNGVSRAPIVIRGSDQVPIKDISLSNFNMWTTNGKRLEHQCKNVYGSGYCARAATKLPLATFTSTMTVTATPTGYVAPTKPTWGVAGYGVTIAIPVYTPAAFWKASSVGVKTKRSNPKARAAPVDDDEVTFVTATIPVVPVRATDGSVSTPLPTLVTIVSSAATSTEKAPAVATEFSYPEHTPSFAFTVAAELASTLVTATATATAPVATATYVAPSSETEKPGRGGKTDVSAWWEQIWGKFTGGRD